MAPWVLLKGWAGGEAPAAAAAAQVAAAADARGRQSTRCCLLQVKALQGARLPETEEELQQLDKVLSA